MCFMKWSPDTNTQETMKRRRRNVFWFSEVFSTCSPAKELLLEVWDPSGSSVRYWFYDGVTGKSSRQLISRPVWLKSATKSGLAEKTDCF